MFCDHDSVIAMMFIAGCSIYRIKAITDAMAGVGSAHGIYVANYLP